MSCFYALLDNIPTNTTGFEIAERPVIPANKQVIEKVQVQTRHGSLIKKRMFQDRTISIVFNILEERNIKHDLRLFKGLLSNKKTLQFSDDDVYFKINNIEFGDFDNEVEFYGYGTVVFDIQPFDYAVTPPRFLYQPETLYSMGTIEADPLISIFGQGDIDLHINEQVIQLKGVRDFIHIDCDLKEAYRENDEGMENRMIGKFPQLLIGNTDVSWKGNVEYVVIEPRWRYR